MDLLHPVFLVVLAGILLIGGRTVIVIWFPESWLNSMLENFDSFLLPSDSSDTSDGNGWFGGWFDGWFDGCFDDSGDGGGDGGGD